MKEEKENKKNVNVFLQTLKRIFIDNPEEANVIPSLDDIVPENEREAKLIEELKESQINIDNRFKSELKVKHLKRSETSPKEQMKPKSKNRTIDVDKEEKIL